MAMFAVTLVCTISLFCAVRAQIPALGPCPGENFPTQKDFKIEKYQGTWYEFQRDFIFFEFLDKCSRANYTLLPNGHISVVNTGEKLFFGTKDTAYGDAYIPNPSDPSKLIAKVGGGPESPYWVVSTDYDNYSVVYLCIDKKIPGLPFFPYRNEILWILSRTRDGLSQEQLTSIYKIIDDLNLTRKFLMRTDQTGCSDTDDAKNEFQLMFAPAKSPMRATHL